MSQEQIAIELRIKNQQLANDIKVANKEIAKLKTSFQATATSGSASMDKLAQSTAKAAKSISALNTVLRAVAIVSAGQAILGQIKTLSNYVSSIQAANNQLKSITDTSAEFAKVQAGVLQISNEVGSAYEETAVTVSRLARAMEEFGGTQDQALIVTDSLNKAMLLTGTTGAEATSTLVQFSQALQSGLLQGDELRSLRENAPAVIKAIADEMKVPVSAIKELGKEGKITTEVIVRALTAANKKLSEEAAKIPLTLDRSIQVASNNFANFYTNSQSLNTLMGDLALSIKGAADTMLIMAGNMADVDTTFDEGITSVTGLTNGFDLLNKTIKGIVGALYSLGIGFKLVVDEIINAFKSVGKVIGISVATWTTQLDGFKLVMRGIFSLDQAQIDAGRAMAKKAGEAFLSSLSDEFDRYKTESSKDLEEARQGLADFWLGVEQDSKKLKFNPDGEWTDWVPPVVDGVKKVGEALKEVSEDSMPAFLSAWNEMQSMLDGFSTPAEKIQADLEAVEYAIMAVEIAAENAGIAIDEDMRAKLDKLHDSSVNKAQESLDGLQKAWTDLSTALDENGVKMKEQNDLWNQFIETANNAGITSIEDITAAFNKFNADTKAIAEEAALNTLGKDIASAFGDAAESIAKNSKNIGETLRELGIQVGKLILQFLLLKAFGALSGTTVPTVNVPAAPVGNFSALSGFGSASPQVNVFNYGSQAGGVQTRGNSSGGVDIVIGQVVNAINRGGNSLDSALRRSYGLGRVGA